MSTQEELSLMCDSLRSLTGIRVCIYDNTGVFTLKSDPPSRIHFGHYGPFCSSVRALKNNSGDCLHLCTQCDRREAAEYAQQYKRPFFHRCYIGLTEYVIPLISENQYVGIAFLGQCQVTDRDNPDEILNHIVAFGGDREHFQNLYNDMVKVPAAELVHAGILFEMGLRYFTVHYKELFSENLHSSLISSAETYIRQYHMLPIQAKDVAQKMHVSDSHLSRVFKKELGKTVLEYINYYRLRRAKELLVSTTIPISAVSENSGFSDPNYFSRYFKKCEGCTPHEYRLRERKNESVSADVPGRLFSSPEPEILSQKPDFPFQKPEISSEPAD